jgi:hypothetical protein
MWGKYDVVEYLLEKNADVTNRNEDNESALTLLRCCVNIGVNKSETLSHYSTFHDNAIVS